MELQTERLRLGKLTEQDWPAISFLRSDPVVNKYVKRPAARVQAEAVAFITKINKGIENDKWFYWGIALKAKHETIGTICLWNFSPDRKVAEVGFDLLPDFQGKGIMSEALRAVLSYGFADLKLDTIEAFTHRENTPSIHLLEKFKFNLLKDRVDENDADNIILELKNVNFPKVN